MAHKNRIEKPGQMVWSQLYIKTFGVDFVNSILDDNCGYNKKEITKKVATNMTGPLLNIWMFCIAIEHIATYGTKFNICVKNFWSNFY